MICLGDPSLCEGDQCNQCTFGVQDGQTDLCSGTKNDCFNCDATTDGCAGLTSDADRRKCYDLYVCVRDAACVNGAGDPFPCWCGTTAYGACSSGGTPANGPCVAQVVAAAGTADQATIAGRLANPNYPLGRAWNLAGCRSNFCGKRIDPDHPACPRW